MKQELYSPNENIVGSSGFGACAFLGTEESPELGSKAFHSAEATLGWVGICRAKTAAVTLSCRCGTMRIIQLHTYLQTS